MCIFLQKIRFLQKPEEIYSVYYTPLWLVGHLEWKYEKRGGEAEEGDDGEVDVDTR